MVEHPITTSGIEQVAVERFGNMVKAVVDVRRRIMAIGGDLHADEEKELLERGSGQSDLWGINIYPQEESDNRVEFDSMINIRPRQNNRSRGVEDPQIREQIAGIVRALIV